MKILFIGKYYYFESLPIMYLSGYLKKHGYNPQYLDLKFEKNIIREVKKYSPDIIAYNTVLGVSNEFIKINHELKKHLSFLSIFGGPQCTLFPELINEDHIDIICRGDGEEALLELIEKLETEKDISDIESLWIKIDNKIYKNPIRKQRDNIDLISFPDRSIFDKYNHYKKLKRRQVITGRGCPFNCSYCHNNALRGEIGNKGLPHRQRSVDNVIEELKFIKKTYHPKRIKFEDDTLFLNKKWSYDFLKKYRELIKTPFNACVRIDYLDENLIKQMKESGCDVVEYGIETGNENFRMNVLNRRVSNDIIIKNSLLLKKYKIKRIALNMLALPDETIDLALETLKINIQCKVSYSHNQVYTPYPLTELGEKCIENGAFIQEIQSLKWHWRYAESILNLKDKKKIKMLQLLFSITARFPFILPLTEQLIKLPFRKLYQIIFFIHRSVNVFFISKSLNISELFIIKKKLHK